MPPRFRAIGLLVETVFATVGNNRPIGTFCYSVEETNGPSGDGGVITVADLLQADMCAR